PPIREHRAAHTTRQARPPWPKGSVGPHHEAGGERLRIGRLFGGRELSLLQLVDVSKGYPGGVRALSGVTLDIPPGMFGLLGPNGAGKSTLMRTIATLQAPDSGAITFDGIDV